MSGFRFVRSALAIGLLSSLVCVGAQAQEATTTTTTVERHEIISPVPKSESCTTVNAHWEGNIWVAASTVCKYENRVEGIAWMQDSWACTVYNVTSGECTTWDYRPGHWVKTLP